MEFVADHALGAAAGLAALLALFAWAGDRRRMRRRDLDRVGVMPWTTLFFWSLFVAVLFGAAAAQGWLAAR